MIVYLDTSAFLKLYVAEEGSEAVHDVIDSGAEIAVSSLSYVEAHSALARRQREGSVGRQDVARILAAFEADWFRFGKVTINDSILRRAGKLCLKHALRSLDAIQLATALVISEHQEEPLVFFSADTRLQAAARREKLKIIE